ncbi:helix-hairpin-helix domain-containing protein [Alkalihalobacillus macyae]|uniref:helix-hairpin-helix domain-containing protein n=1 Tax=Guptibacillus hwajinpoensis TaxID=208199 RepID=UPI00273BB4C7|nr:helix-hairpin-helix domain-containing protein [Alkalihalobacillus macyae]MDP4550090.1 helix-hairpin-helix domain-containing protein [Alkalihalobacillus macyae]
MKEKRPKLPLSQEEKQILRKKKIRLSDFHKLNLEEIQGLFDVSNDRAKELKGLAIFQQVPSIGHELAFKLVNHLGYFSLEQIKSENWAEVFHNLEKNLGCWTDPCVEDQIICIIHYANNPESKKQWFDFTTDRKLYRQQNGYPISRPKIAWYGK